MTNDTSADIDVTDYDRNYVWILAIPKATMHKMTEEELVEQFEQMKKASLTILDHARRVEAQRSRIPGEP